MSIEFVEQPRAERDLGRANWQRSVGAVVMREFMEPALQKIPELSESQLEICESNAHPKSSNMGLAWARAYYIAETILRTTADDVYGDDNVAPYELRKQFNLYTYEKNIAYVITEGVSTMAAFPLSLARSIAETEEDTINADLQKPKFGVESLRDIATMLHQPYFRDMMETALFISNGFWEGFSTSKGGKLPEAFNSIDVYSFHEDGTVSFSPEALRIMHSVIRSVNIEAPPPPYAVTKQSSSGCPARHLRPSFNSPEDMASLDMLSGYFGKSPEQLTEKHDQNVVQLGLDFVIRGLEQYSDWFTQRDREYGNGYPVPVKLPYDRQAFPTKLPSAHLNS